MTARERIEYLLDKGSATIEIGAFAGDGMYEEHGGCPSGGVVVKIGYVRGRQCVVCCQRRHGKSRSLVPHNGKKEPPGTGNCHGKQATYYLPGRQCWSLPPDAG